MLASYTALELLLAFAVALLVGLELHGILDARKKGLSTNVWRVVIRVVMLATLAVYVGISLFFLPLELGTGGIEKTGTPTVPWNFLILGVMLTLLASVEAITMMRAMRKGLTTNGTRLVHYLVAFLVIVAMLGLSVRKWDYYLQRLEITYSEDIPQGSSGSD